MASRVRLIRRELLGYEHSSTSEKSQESRRGGYPHQVKGPTNPPELGLKFFLSFGTQDRKSIFSFLEGDWRAIMDHSGTCALTWGPTLVMAMITAAPPRLSVKCQ